MSVCRKLPDGTIQKIAGHTILLDANASEVRQGRWNLVSRAVEWVEQNIIFTDPMPDNDYIVIIESDSQSWAAQPGPYRITNKTTTGFTLASYNMSNASSQVNMNIAGTYTAFKPVKIEGYTELQNKINNPDEEPTENSENLVKSGGVWEAIKNASAVWKGTQAEWNALPVADKQTYDLAVLTDAGYILAVDRTDGSSVETANLNKIWQGAEADWEALPVATKKVYDFAVIKDAHYILSVDKSTGDTTKVASLPVGDVIRNPDWSRAVSYTTSQLYAGITMPDDGIFTACVANANAVIKINGRTIARAFGRTSSDAAAQIQIPVAKGDIAKSTDADLNSGEIYFVPYKTADSISGRSPVGAVQAYYGASDPEEGNWLICDGRDTTGTAIELATVYPKLYRFLGNSNVLPDLRGEFLRGAGTNSHSGEGSGGSVGQHQGGSPITSFYPNFNVGSIDFYAGGVSGSFDAQASTSNIINVTGSKKTYATGSYGKTRPTNTSVNWIICAR